MERLSSKPIFGLLALIAILFRIFYVAGLFSYKVDLILNILTIILLFMTLNTQIQLNKMQGKRDETDLVFSLYSQMDKDFDNIYAKHFTREGNAKVTTRFQGMEAIYELVDTICYQNNDKNKFPVFGYFFEAMQLDGVLKSYELILRRLKDSPLPLDQKDMLTQKMKIFFSAKLEYACECLSKAFDDYPNLRDEKSGYLQQFYRNNKAGMHEVSPYIANGSRSV